MILLLSANGGGGGGGGGGAQPRFSENLSKNLLFAERIAATARTEGCTVGRLMAGSQLPCYSWN